MLRKRALLFTGAAMLVAAAGLVACGGDDSGVAPPGVDAGVDAITPHPDAAPPVDANPPPPGDAGADTNPPPPADGGHPDSGDGGPCDFNTFVIGLITNHTNSTDLPSTDLGQNCVDTQTPFPATVFQ